MNLFEQTIQKEIAELKNGQELMKKDIRDLQNKTLIHDRDIIQINKVLADISDDTKWLRRAITNAFITGLIGGGIAVFYAFFQH